MNKENEQVFLSRINQHKGILHKVARMYTDHPDDRADLQQEIMIQLWKSYAHYEGQSAFSTWMYRVAINTAITYYKQEKRRNNTFQNELTNEPIQEEYDSHRDHQLEIFYQAIHHLSALEKALMFYYMEGLSHQETGLQLGLTEGNVRVKLSRTKEKLQAIIKKSNHEL